MVKAILDGSKTQTRRVVKPQPTAILHNGLPWVYPPVRGKGDIRWPYAPGNILWVRETWRPRVTDSEDFIQYKADGVCEVVEVDKLDEDQQHQWRGIFYDHGEIEEEKRWRPSIHMPRWACRLRLEVVSVRVERLLDISGEDAIAEGIEKPAHENGFPAKMKFFLLWESIYGAASLGSNPYVWVIEYRRLA